ncbi:serine hydrolase [Variovorax sp. J22G21]|uniref:serine hydrolase domain-containing protein n=1 Tax=Variovorax fucosicus TaxID=3053517 RepID=UPI00257922FF|nr:MULTISPECIES: serine hydrolase [unclassified Variovorax]MDM0039031.1 serine hydrolase [Variovorax sp. J22R193]MDM0063807.1 serine hydrolase [Variovorax sp. J22G21]
MTSALPAKLKNIGHALMLLFVLGSVQGCSSPEPLVRAADELSAPLPSAQPSEVEMDGALLRQAVSDLPPESEHGLRSMLVMRRGKLVLETYWNGRDGNVQQDIRSATKSVTSLLLGIAVDRGLVKSVQEPVRTYLGSIYPESALLKQDVKVEHLLTMRSGAACNDHDGGSPGQEDKMYRERDWVGFFLALPMANPAGEAAHYCTGGVVALGRILAATSKASVPEFANNALFDPLGITGARWSRFDNGRQTDTGGHLFLRPQDMLRIGQLVLQGGVWNGRQLVSRAWIEQSTREHTRIDNRRPYGYLWWPQPAPYRGRQVRAILADGNGGQYIFVVPELELVAVFTGGNYNSRKAQRPFEIMSKYILPAVQAP